MNVAAAPSSALLNEAIDRYHDVLTACVDRGGEDHLALLDRMVQRGAVFAGRPICTFLRPQFLLRSQQELMSRVIAHFRSAVVKARDAIMAEPALLELMALTDGERRPLAINSECELFFSRGHIEHDPYLFRGETRGVLTRLSATSDCRLGNLHAGAGTVPTFILEDTPSAG